MSYAHAQEMVKDFTVLDFETTGFSPKVGKIIQVAAVRYRNFVNVKEYSTYVNPGVAIPELITEITGITDFDVYGADGVDKVLPELLTFIGEDVIVAHNASFDMSFLLANMQKERVDYKKFKVIDTLSLARDYIKAENHKLPTLKGVLGLNDYSSHEALSDCIVTGELYKYCCGQKELEEQLSY